MSKSDESPKPKPQSTVNMIQDVYDDYYDAALEKIAKRIQSRPFNPRAFFIGVSNLVSSVFVATKWPEFYPILHVVKSVFLFGLLIKIRLKAKHIYYMLDFCWVYNILKCVFLAGMFGLWFFFGMTQLFQDIHMVRMFAIANGPLAFAAVGLNNSMVFHHFQHTASLFIHFSPLVISFIFRWYSHEINAVFNGLIANPDYETPEFWEFHKQGIIVYLFWFIPFCIWQLTDGLTRPAKGWDTVFNSNLKSLRAADKNFNLGIGSDFGLCVAYLLCHCMVANVYICFARLFWNYQYANAALIIFVASRCTWNGAKYYEYIYGKGLVKLLKKLELKERSKKQT